MDLKQTQEELDAAYKKLAKAEDRVSKLDAELGKQFRVEAILIAAGFLTQEKIRDAESLLDGL